MNTLPRRQQNKLEKQQRILTAARKVFAAEGYSGASMDLIADKAGLSKPTLYSYYATKAALFEAMLTAPRDAMLLAFEDDPGAGMVAQLWRFAWTYADTVMHPDFLSLARLVIGEAQRFPEIGRAYQESGPDKVLAGLTAFMAAQRKAGRITCDNPELAAEDFWGLILSAPRNRALHQPDQEISAAALARSISNGIRVFLRAYSTSPAAELAAFEGLLAANGPDNTAPDESSVIRPSPLA